MYSLKLQTTLVVNTFSSSNYYQRGIDTYDLVLHHMNEIPVICYNTDRINDTYTIDYGSQESFRGRKLTKPKIVEVLQTSSWIQTVKYGDKLYFVAQGFLAEYGETPFENIIFLHSINKFLNREDVLSCDINLYINKKYIHNPEFKKEEVLIKEFVNMCDGNIIYTSDPLAKFEKRLIFKSKSIQGLKKELNFYVSGILRDLRNNSVKELTKANGATLDIAVYNPIYAQYQEKKAEAVKQRPGLNLVIPESARVIDPELDEDDEDDDPFGEEYQTTAVSEGQPNF